MSRARSWRLARRTAPAMKRATSRENPAGAPVAQPHSGGAITKRLPFILRLHRERTLGGAHEEPLSRGQGDDLLGVGDPTAEELGHEVHGGPDVGWWGRNGAVGRLRRPMARSGVIPGARGGGADGHFSQRRASARTRCAPGTAERTGLNRRVNGPRLGAINARPCSGRPHALPEFACPFVPVRWHQQGVSPRRPEDDVSRRRTALDHAGGLRVPSPPTGTPEKS